MGTAYRFRRTKRRFMLNMVPEIDWLSPWEMSWGEKAKKAKKGCERCERGQTPFPRRRSSRLPGAPPNAHCLPVKWVSDSNFA